MKFTEAMKAAWDAGKAYYNNRGEEVPDPRPIELPVGFKAPLPLSDEIRLMLQRQVQNELSDKGIETFEDADDFDIPDEDMSAPWEEGFEAGRIWTRENEIRAGVVTPPDLEGASKLRAKAKEYLDKKAQTKGTESEKSTAGA